MASDGGTRGAVSDCEVMASVDGSPERLVIAELCSDDAWVSVPVSEAAGLDRWR